MSAEGVDPAPTRFSAQDDQTLQCAILFLDLVGYSARPVDEQVLIKKRLNLLLKRVLRGVAAEHRLAIDTGDGAAVCFLGDPMAALHSALLLRELLSQRYGPALNLRIGLHLGPVRVVPDVNGSLNVVGDGINAAQRIMDFAQPNEVLASRAFREVAVQATPPPACQFREAGLHADKHGRVHELYRIEEAARRTGEPAASYAVGHAAGPTDPRLPPSLVNALEVALTRRIGPMARLLIEQALARGAPAADLPLLLAAHIASVVQREAFLDDARRLLLATRLTPPPDPPPR